MTSWEERKEAFGEIPKAKERSICELCSRYEEQEANKGVRGMPRLSEATKDVVSCEKLRGLANED